MTDTKIVSKEVSDDLTLTKFKGRPNEDYNLWKFRLKSVLRGKQYWNKLLSKDCPEDVKEKAEAILVSGLGDAPLRSCMGESPDVMKMIESLDKTYASKRAASKIAVLTSVFSKRYTDNKNMSKYIDEYNQAFAQLESMGKDAKIPESLKGPILIASFGTDSQLESCIAALRVRDSIPSWEELTADLILEASRIRTSKKNSDPDNDANPKAGRKRTLFANKFESKSGKQTCGYCHKQGHSADKCHQNPANPNNRLSKREKDAILAALTTKPDKKKDGEELHFGASLRIVKESEESTTSFPRIPATNTKKDRTPSKSDANHLRNVEGSANLSKGSTQDDLVIVDSGASKSFFRNKEEVVPSSYNKGSKVQVQMAAGSRQDILHRRRRFAVWFLASSKSCSSSHTEQHTAVSVSCLRPRTHHGVHEKGGSRT